MDTIQSEKIFSNNLNDDDEYLKSLAEELKLLFVELKNFKPDLKAVGLVPKNIAENLQVLPLHINSSENTLTVATYDPLNFHITSDLKTITGLEIKLCMATRSDIKNNFDRFYKFHNTLENAISINNKSPNKNFTTLSIPEGDYNSDDAPVIKLVNDIISQAVNENASDIHFETYEDFSRVRFRVDGYLYTAFEYPVNLHPILTSRVKLISGMDIAAKIKPQDGRILTQISERYVDLRVSALPTMNGEKIVIRILYRDSEFNTLETLGLEPDDAKLLKNFCERPYGILLATGPTGSGKSTTLYSILRRLNTPDTNIITVEDPVEFYISGINQIQVNEAAGLNFENALRSILRQDPDKIMIGEIRDTNTAQIAIRAALTGHFVLSTLHTNDAPGAATRLLDMEIAPFLVASALTGVIAQRLVRKLCPNCRREYLIERSVCDTLGLKFGTKAFKPVGCQLCHNGYKGRTAIFEIMAINDELRDLILTNPDNLTLRRTAIKYGMKTLRQSGINAALKGLASLEEILSVTL